MVTEEEGSEEGWPIPWVGHEAADGLPVGEQPSFGAPLLPRPVALLVFSREIVERAHGDDYAGEEVMIHFHCRGYRARGVLLRSRFPAHFV